MVRTISSPRGAAAGSFHDAPSAAATDRRRGRRGLDRRRVAASWAAAALLLPSCRTAPTPAAVPAAFDAAVAAAVRELAAELDAAPAGAGPRQVAVVPPAAAPPGWGDLAADLPHRVADRLAEAAPGLRLVERHEALWREHDFSASGLVAPSEVLRLGRMAGADTLLLGDLTVLAGQPQIHLRLVRVETSEVLARASTAVALTPEPGRAAAPPSGGGDGEAAAVRRVDADPPPAAESGGAAPPEASTPPSPGRQTVGDFRLGLEGCGFVAGRGTVVCRLRFENVAPGPRALTFLATTRIHDTDGAGYRLQQVRIGGFVGDLATPNASVRHVFPGELTAAVDLVFSEMSRRKRKIQRLDLAFDEGPAHFSGITIGRD